MMKAVSIVGSGPNLAGDLYLPDLTRGPVPAVVTGSGFGGVKEMLLPAFGEALAAAGIAVLSIDFAGFGASSGAPRQEVDPVAQVADLRRGLDYLSTMPGIDPARLGVWGPSMCGAHTLVVAGTDPRVRAAVSIIPFTKAPRLVAARVSWAVVVDAVRRLFGASGKTIAASGEPGDLAVMTTDGALAWIQEVSAGAPSFRNEVTLASLLKVGAYRPMRMVGASGIRVPLLTILAKDDTLTPATSARAELSSVARHDVVEFPGTHFELFGVHLSAVVDLTVNWFTRHLLTEQDERPGVGPQTAAQPN
jgi:dienelactone hydrolase